MRSVLVALALLVGCDDGGSAMRLPPDGSTRVDAAVVDADARDAAVVDADAPDATLVDADAPDAALPPAALTLDRHDDGRVDLGDGRGRVFLRGAWAEARVRIGEAEIDVSTAAGCEGAWSDDDAPLHDGAYFAGAAGWRFDCRAGDLELSWRVHVDAAHDVALARVELTHRGAAEITALRLTPLITEAAFVGADPARHRILDNGSNIAMDVEANLHFPDEPRFGGVDALLEIPARGNVVSNWNHAIVDLDSGRSLVAGALTVEHAFPAFGTRFSAADSPTDEATGRRGFAAYVADQPLLFYGKPLAAGESLVSEPVYLDPMAPDPFTGLEDYADAVAAWQRFTVWTRRGAGRPVPNGWNSWSGSGGTGGLGTNIDAAIMAENLAVMAREFAPFGVDYFQIDDGYQIADGDWEPREDRFPEGVAAFATRVVEAGLLPGIWISPFTVDLDSALAAAHPDWLSAPEENVLRGLFAPDRDQRTLDLSHPEVLPWLRSTLRRYRDAWGMAWIKVDFAYLAFLFRPRADPRLTSVEAYRRAILTLREALGDDVFYLGVGLMGVNYGVVDSMRLTLDAGPRWEQGKPFALLGDGNSFKSTVKTGARRYYLHNRVWITHNDLLFFRTDREHPEPPVTLQEAITLSSFIGLTGSIVKFGEDLRTLTSEQINVWRRLLPIYPATARPMDLPATARPMDLFVRHYAERYRLPVERAIAGGEARWMIVGLLNWGRNYDFDVRPAAEMPDAARRYVVDLAAWGLAPDRDYLAQEFWSETFLGGVRGTLVHEVPAHGAAVIALREALGHPQLLGHNRHLTQGGTDLVEASWDEGAQALTLAFDVDAGGADAVPFEYRFRVHVPAGFEPAGGDVGDGVVTFEAPVLTVTYTPAAPGRYAMRLVF